MNTEARRAIEAVLMAATEPVEPQMLAQLVELPVAEVEGLCALLAAECSGRGFILAKVAGGYRFQTHPDLAPYVERYLLEGRHSRLSNAALETLAVIAYKQPVTRSQLSAVRGVDVDGVVRSLLERGYITELGRDEGPGHPIRYGTTPLFLERLGLESLDKLPPLAELVPGVDVIEDLEARLREAARPAGPPVRRRRRSRRRRVGEGQGRLGEGAEGWDATGNGGRAGTNNGGRVGTGNGGRVGTNNGGRVGTNNGGRVGTNNGGRVGTNSGGRVGTNSGGRASGAEVGGDAG